MKRIVLGALGLLASASVAQAQWAAQTLYAPYYNSGSTTPAGVSQFSYQCNGAGPPYSGCLPLMTLFFNGALVSGANPLPITAARGDYLFDTGTSNSGMITGAAVSLMTTELNALAVNGSATSTTIFSTANTGAAVQGYIRLQMGAIGTALTAGSVVSGWFLTSIDGTAFETPAANAALPRPPDFIIPLPATAITAATYYGASGTAGGKVDLPALKFKVYIQNNASQALAATTNILVVAPIAVQK